jgi:aldose 1-epimerase
MTKITTKPFGKTDKGSQATLYTFTNGKGSEVAITDFGGSIVSIKVPDRDGKLADIVLGYDDVKGYESRRYFFGASIGRCGNRIGLGRFTLNGKEYQLNCNDGRNHLHGGFTGFDSVLWDATVKGDSLSLHHVFPDGDENYPGNLDVTITFSFGDDGTFAIRYEATSDKDTICNPTNHSYFNLAGHDTGDILSQQIKIHAEKFTEADAESIPTGKILDVAGTPMDFREFHVVGDRIEADYEQLKFAGGYDHNWVLDKGGDKMGACAEIYDAKSGRHVTCTTTLPCVQFYCGNFIAGDQAGKGGFVYKKRAGLCLETQFAPDAINRPEFDSPVLKAGKKFDSTTVYHFDIK